MRRWVTGLLPLLLTGCLSVPDSGAPVHGTEVGVIVHNYALAFRDFLSGEAPRTRLPAYLNAPLPLTGSEWYVDDITAPTPVTTTNQSTTSVATVACSQTHCVRSVVRQFADGFRNDETLSIYYARGDTTETFDDEVLGFESLVRYVDHTQALRRTTAPTEGPWVITTEVGFPEHDFRQRFERTEKYDSLTSDTTPAGVEMVFQTKEARTGATLKQTADAWRYSETVTYEAFRNLKHGQAEYSVNAGLFEGATRLRYASGVEIAPHAVSGGETDWEISGGTVALGEVSGRRSGDAWERTITFPKGSRFKSLTDRGTYPDENRQGAFVREIIGKIDTLRIDGTYREKLPGIWEVKGATDQGIRFEFVYQSLDFTDAFAGFWTQPNPRLNSLDTSEFTIYRHPDWTSKMNYAYARSDTPYPTDESGVILFTPDTRGAARISVVQDEAGDVSEHRDYNLRIVAEGQEAASGR